MAAWVADALMFTWCGLFKRDILLTIDRIESEVSKWDGINVTLHKFGGLQFNFNNREIGHIHSNGILDILFNRNTKSILVERGMASDHHVFPDSGWISFYIRQADDGDSAIKLLKLAYLNNKPEPAVAEYDKLRAIGGLRPVLLKNRPLCNLYRIT